MIKAIIIDDEKRARNVLRNLILQFCPEIEVLAECSNVPDGVIAINKYNPNVVFCDIEMPNYSGLELVDFFDKINFEIIFATGYNEYAIKAFELSAVEYLLKPIGIDKLEIAVAKLKQRLEQKNMLKRLTILKENLGGNSIKIIALPVIDGLIFVDVIEIDALEADGSYTTVFLCDGRKILISKRIKYFETLLDKHHQFYRIHRSYIININSIKKYSRKESSIYLNNDLTVKIARDKKAEFEEYINDVKL